MVKTEVVEALVNHLSTDAIVADEANYPLGYGTADDVANAVVFFLSPASRWVTGTNFIMDGGLM
jgi:NAD(P)-dependent dehydrogenase (short-subunit alcohol dehydrogenase family)